MQRLPARPAAPDECIGDVVARVAARLRAVGGPLQRAELDALAHDIVLDVARFVLRWAEGPDTAGAGPSARRGSVAP